MSDEFRLCVESRLMIKNSHISCGNRSVCKCVYRCQQVQRDELPIQQAEVDAAVDPKVQKTKSSSAEEEQVAAVEETTEVAAKTTITSKQAAEEVEQAQE
ncbi:hypothetical protein SprV_0401399600 [Sparganum proliferum]